MSSTAVEKRKEISIAILLSISLGALNSVLVKIKSDELQIFDGVVTGIMNAIGYCLLYWPMLALRWLALGKVSTQELKFMFLDEGRRCGGAQRYIVLGGLADETGQILSAVAQPYVSIVASTLLSQSSSLWTMLTSASLLAARYTLQECIGVGISVAGASLEIFAIDKGQDHDTNPFMAGLILLSAIAPAFSFALKEKCFRLWQKKESFQQETKKPLDEWVVASAAGLWSLLWAPLLCLATAYIKKPSHITLRTYLSQAFACFSNQIDYADHFLDHYHHDDSDTNRACTYAWQWWCLYMTVNVLYNISIYRVVRLASALTSFVTGKLVAPATLILTLAPWPLIGRGMIKPIQIFSLFIILFGVAVFRHGTIRKEALLTLDDSRLAGGVCCWPLRQWHHGFRSGNTRSYRPSRLPDFILDSPLSAEAGATAVLGQKSEQHNNNILQSPLLLPPVSDQ